MQMVYTHIEEYMVGCVAHGTVALWEASKWQLLGGPELAPHGRFGQFHQFSPENPPKGAFRHWG